MSMVRIITMPIRTLLVVIVVALYIPIAIIHAIISPEETMKYFKEALYDARQFITHGV